MQLCNYMFIAKSPDEMKALLMADVVLAQGYKKAGQSTKKQQGKKYQDVEDFSKEFIEFMKQKQEEDTGAPAAKEEQAPAGEPAPVAPQQAPG
jgi:hypothetical protein